MSRVHSAVLFSRFSVGLLTAQVPEPAVFAGLRADSRGFRPLRRRRPGAEIDRSGRSRRLQSGDQRTPHLPTGGATALDEPLKRGFDALQVGELGSYIRQLALGLLAGFGAK